MPIVIVVVALVVAVAVFVLVRRSGGGEATGSPVTEREMFRPRVPYREFHVSEGGALVYFDVPLPPGEVDDVLAQLLVREAVEVLRDKQSHDLPLDDVDNVRAFGTRDGEDIEAGSISLEIPGALPDIDHIEVIPHYSSETFDPLTHLGDADHGPPASGAAQAPGDAGQAVLPPIGDELSISGRLDSGLRTQGLDPATMSAGDMALGLMRLAGYTVAPSKSDNTYVAATPGSRTFVQIVPHEAGGYPELDEQQMKEFQVGLASAGADRGILVTEKFGPYMIYDAERRNPKCKFITRERLQDFVDSFAIS